MEVQPAVKVFLIYMDNAKYHLAVLTHVWGEFTRVGGSRAKTPCFPGPARGVAPCRSEKCRDNLIQNRSRISRITP